MISNMKFDDVFKQLGEFGRYQKVLYFLLCLPAIPGSMLVMQTIIFLFAVPKHRCAIPGLHNDTYEIQNKAHEELVNLTIPTVSDFYGHTKYSNCELYSFTNTSDLWSPDETNVTASCHEWVYDKSQYISTAAESLNFVCGRRSYVSHAKMIPMAAQLVGSLVNGPLADTFGRRPLIIANTFVYVHLSIVLGFVNSVPLMFFVLFVCYQCTMGQYITCFVFGMEIVAPSKRMWTGVTMNFFWSIGNMLVALSAFLLRDWRIRQLVISVPAVLFAYLFFLPESPRWLLRHGKTEEAKKVLMKIAKGNKTKIDAKMLDDVSVSDENKQEEPLWKLFKSPVLLRRMLIICYNWFAVGMSFYGLSMNVTNLSGSIYLNFFLFVMVEVFAYILCYLLMDRLGRKRLLSFFLLATGATCALPLIPVLISDQPYKWVINSLAIIGNTCASVTFAVVYTFTAELMPTTTRNSCMGMGSVFSRVGSMISPYIVDLTMYVTGRFGQILPMLVFGTIAAIAGLLALLLPETLNKRLPETIEDAEKIGTKSYDDDAVEYKEWEMTPLDTEANPGRNIIDEKQSLATEQT